MVTKHQTLPAQIATWLDAAATNSAIPAPLARAVAWIESRGDAKAQSGVGAQGVMQLMPTVQKEYGVTDPFDARQNIAAGVALLARLLRKYQQNEALALAAYNWGPGNVDEALRESKDFPQQVRDYVRNVQARKIEEGGRAAATPFFGESQLRLQCPHCSRDTFVRVEVELQRVARVVGT